MKKFRYEFPPMEPHYLEAPHADAAVRFLRRVYPHNIADVLPTLREIPRWPEFWKTLDHQGLVLPRIG
ncbi:MAG: hypothetical protein R3A51_05165 [Nannocystaceae bacterium]|nr:hypothetical protein [Myxococcales bacterium]